MIRESPTRSSRTTRMLGLAGALCLTVGVAGAPAHAAEAPVGLGTAGSFAVLAGQAVTNTGSSVVTGDIGLTPGVLTSVTGIPPLIQTGGVLHAADAVAIQAQADLTTAYNTAASRPTVTDVTSSNLGGQTFTSGVVAHTSGMQLTGTITLDAQNDPDAVFIFKAGSTLVTASNSTVALINGASPCNVYWQVGSSATLGTDSAFVGTIMALTSATLDTGARVEGRVLARNGSVTLDTNVINRPFCAASGSESPAPSPTASPTTSTPTETASPSTTTPVSPSATASPSGNGNDNGGGSGNDGSHNGGNGSDSAGSAVGGGSGLTTGSSAAPPVVPDGHPETGLGGSQPTGPAWGILALLLCVTAAAGTLSWRRADPSRRAGR